MEYSPSDVLLGTDCPNGASSWARDGMNEDIANSNREGVVESEEGEKEIAQGELHDGLEHGGSVVKRGRRGCSGGSYASRRA